MVGIRRWRRTRFVAGLLFLLGRRHGRQCGGLEGVQQGLDDPARDVVEPGAPQGLDAVRFTANYIATGTATAGPANAKAAFTVDYQ